MTLVALLRRSKTPMDFRFRWKSGRAADSLTTRLARARKCIQGLVHPRVGRPFIRAFKGLTENGAYPQRIVATVSNTVSTRPLLIQKARDPIEAAARR